MGHVPRGHVSFLTSQLPELPDARIFGSIAPSLSLRDAELKRQQKGHEVFFLLFIEMAFQHQIEELDGVCECEQAVVM
jgi:hypothetical protein